MMRFLVLVLALSACADDSSPTPLACKAVAFCTTYDVKTFTGTVPAAAGGKISDGIYRLAYKLIPDNVGEKAGYSDDLDVLEIQGGGFNWAGFFRDYVGTVATAGTKVTFTRTQRCDRGSDKDADTTVNEYQYSATGDELHIYSKVMRSDGVSWDQMAVYKRTGSPDEICKTVNAPPASPADSAMCTVTNCACRLALEGTVNACS